MRIYESLSTTEPLAALFDDQSVVAAMLRFEAALARAQATAGVIPVEAAEAIGKTADARHLDLPALADTSQRAGTPAIPLVNALTTRLRATDSDAARWVHWGATSQDVVDTAMVLLLRDALGLIRDDHEKLAEALARLSHDHAETVLLGRTLLQAAPPVTLGLKAARWLAAARRGWARVQAAAADALVLQLGGATGTLAALGDEGLTVSTALAAELDLPLPDAPWHTERDRLASLACALGIYAGSLGKMGRDVSLLMQGEIAELSEPRTAGRGGSSTMPQKGNPTACALTLAVTARTPGLVASFLAAMEQEQERAVGGWQSEWATLIPLVQGTGLAAASMAEVAAGLLVDSDRMRGNLHATGGGILAERIMLRLGAELGRDVAHSVVEDAVRRSRAEQRDLGEVLLATPRVAALLSESEMRELLDPNGYLGMAETFRRRLVEG